MSSTIDRHWQRAQRYIAENRIAEAKALLESIVEHAPHRSDVRMILASVMLSEGTIRNASEQAVIASKNLPNHAQPVSTVAHALLRIGETNAARDALLRFNASTTRDGLLLMTLAHAFQALGDHPKALSLMNAAVAVGFDTPDVRYFRSLELQFNGRLDEAREELAACLRLGPTYGRASLAFVRMSKQTAESNHLDYVLEQLKSVEQGTEDHASFKFAEFKILEDLGRYDEAFPALKMGNDIMYARMEHDIDMERREIDALIKKTPADFAQAAASTPPGPMPIFIVGLPRSGTTLLDRILDNHSQVMSTGERIDFPRQVRWCVDVRGQEMLDEKMISRIDQIDFAELGRRYLERTRWRAKGRPFYLDKLPPNFLHAGLIARALPNAPILHMVRDPMDVCYSNYKAMFGESFAYSYNMEALAAHYRQYRRLMKHWHATMPGRIFDVNYNTLVTDKEATIKAVLEYCGLAYEDGLFDTRRNTTAVATLSSPQVREPVHSRTIGEWRRYEKQLEPLRAALADFL